MTVTHSRISECLFNLEIKMDAMKKISKARVGIMTKSELMFFHPLLMRFPCTVTEETRTASTDGREIKFNPEFIAPLSDEEMKGLILHELFHALLHHIDRTKSQKLDQSKANVAGDYAINDMLLADFHMQIPKGGLWDSQYRGMSMEQIYALLPDNPPDNSMEDFDLDTEPLTPEERQEIETAIVSAAIGAQLAGKLPSSMDRFATARAPKVSWAAILQARLTSMGSDDYSLMKPNPALWNGGRTGGIYSPSMVSHKAGHICIAVDVSGSVTEEELSQYMSEVQSIMEDVQPSKITLLSFDSNITSVHSLDCGDDFPTSFPGGGGTDFCSSMSYFSELDNVQCAIFFTDLYGSFPRNAPDFKVLWINTGSPDTSVPFGEKININ